MAAEGGRIDFMFLGAPPYPAAGSATVSIHFQQTKLVFEQSENCIKTGQTKLNFEHLNFNWRSLTRSIVNIKVPFNFTVKEISKQFKCRQDCCFQLYTTIFSYCWTFPSWANHRIHPHFNHFLSKGSWRSILINSQYLFLFWRQNQTKTKIEIQTLSNYMHNVSRKRRWLKIPHYFYTSTHSQYTKGTQ